MYDRDEVGLVHNEMPVSNENITADVIYSVLSTYIANRLRDIQIV